MHHDLQESAIDLSTKVHLRDAKLSIVAANNCVPLMHHNLTDTEE